MFGITFGSKRQIFLAGTCGGSLWREERAIPAIKAARRRFFNPQKEGWTPEDAAIEAAELDESRLILMYIDGKSRGLNSGNELIEQAMKGKRIFMVFENIVDGTEIAGQKVTGRELKDLNNNRGWLREFAKRYENVTLVDSVEEAVQLAIMAC
jgi:hypothetical protein